MALFGLGRKAVKPLRLIAQEADDLPAVAALIQDAALRAGDLTYETSGRHFTVRMNRYCHEANSPVPLRAPSVLRISCVTKVQMRGFDPKQAGQALSLLDIAAEPADAPAHILTLRFAGEGSPDVRIEVECIDILLLDLAAPRPRQIDAEARRLGMRIASIDIDEDSLASPSDQIEHERKVAMFDLIEKNSFTPEGAAEAGSEGPFALRLALEDNRLVFDITGPDFARKIMLSLAPFRTMMRDYQMICGSYYDALKNATPAQIEAIDMGRRGVHNEGAELLAERLKGKVAIDHETARRLFTLVNALHVRA